MCVCSLFMCVQVSHRYMKEPQRHLLEDEGVQTLHSGHILEEVGERLTFTSLIQQNWDILTHPYRSGYLPDPPQQIGSYLM